MQNQMIKKTSDRLDIIRKYLNDHGYAETEDLSLLLNVSSATIRRDFLLLESNGECLRKHGGAISIQGQNRIEIPYDKKKELNSEKKQSIAKTAFKMVRDGDSILIDSGSTTIELAKLLPERNNLLVVTNDLLIALHVSRYPNIRLIILGGEVDNGIYSSYSSYAEEFIASCHFDKVFLSADAIHENGDITDTSIVQASMKKSMIGAGYQVILLADSTKFSKHGFKTVCNVSDIDIVISDSGLSAKSRKMLELNQVDLVIAEEGENNV